METRFRLPVSTAAQQAQEKLEAAAAQRKLQGLREDQPDDEDEGESVEVVRG